MGSVFGRDRQKGRCDGEARLARHSLNERADVQDGVFVHDMLTLSLGVTVALCEPELDELPVGVTLGVGWSEVDMLAEPLLVVEAVCVDASLLLRVLEILAPPLVVALGVSNDDGDVDCDTASVLERLGVGPAQHSNMSV